MCAWCCFFALVTAIAHSTPAPTVGRLESEVQLAEFYETATLAFEIATTDAAHLASLAEALNFEYDVPLELIPRTANFLNDMKAQVAAKEVVHAPGTLDDAFVEAVEFSLSNTRLLAATNLDPDTSVEVAQHFAAIESVLVAAQGAREQEAREPKATQELNPWQLCVVISAVLGGLALTIGVCILGLKLRQRRRRRKRLQDVAARQLAIAETQRLDMIMRMNEALETMENV